MDKYELTKGEGRTKVTLSAYYMGSDLVVCIYNDNAHIDAVALGEYDHKEQRASKLPHRSYWVNLAPGYETGS